MRVWLTAVAVLAASCGRTAVYGAPVSPGAAPPSTDWLPDGGRVPPSGPCVLTPLPDVAWQMQASPSIVCFGQTFAANGDPGEYAFATLPDEGGAAWAPAPGPDIGFATGSRMCGASCGCKAGGDFTYFQTALELTGPPKTLTVTIGDVDDGARVILFNGKHPDGFVAGQVSLFFGGALADLAGEAVVGHNRIVLIHVDDCCSQRRLGRTFVTLDGSDLPPCP